MARRGRCVETGNKNENKGMRLDLQEKTCAGDLGGHELKNAGTYTYLTTLARVDNAGLSTLGPKTGPSRGTGCGDRPLAFH